MTRQDPEASTPATLGQRIRARREAAGLTQRALADRVGTKQPEVSGWEADRGDLKVSTLRRIAEALGCSPCDLLGDT